MPTALVVMLLLMRIAQAQTPQPFPRTGTSAPPPAPRTAPAPQPPAPPGPQAAQAGDPNAPTAATLGIAIYPTAQFLGSYDAGRGQTYHLFGTTAAYVDIVGYYQAQTGERGELVIKDPPTHQFHNGPFVRFNWDTMVFPPGVTVKDWTAGGGTGYPNPKLGGQPARFPTVFMIVTPPPLVPDAPRGR
jgi:hypothetical protein